MRTNDHRSCRARIDHVGSERADTWRVRVEGRILATNIPYEEALRLAEDILLGTGQAAVEAEKRESRGKAA